MKKIIASCLMLFFIMIPEIKAIKAPTDDNGTALKSTIFILIKELKKEANENNPNFQSILSNYLDWDSITRNVIKAAIRNARKSPETKAQFKEFYPNFKTTFQKTVIERYSNPEYLNKFKDTTFDENAARILQTNNKLINVSTSAKIAGADWKITWTINPKNHKIVEADIDGLKIFQTQTSEATAAFNKGFATSYQEGLNQLLAAFSTAS